MKRWIVKWVFTGVVLGAIMSVSSVFAQDPGDVEIGGFGEYMMFDDQRHLDDPIGGGGRLGVFIAPNLSIEGQGSYLPLDRDTGSDRFNVGNGDITLIPFIGRLVYHVPMKKDRTAFLIGAGWIHNKFGSDADIDEDGFNAMLGLSFGGRTVQGRFDFNGNFIPNPYEGLLVDAWDYSATFGLSFFLGRGPKDADHDGISDQNDPANGNACVPNPGACAPAVPTAFPGGPLLLIGLLVATGIARMRVRRTAARSLE